MFLSFCVQSQQNKWILYSVCVCVCGVVCVCMCVCFIIQAHNIPRVQVYVNTQTQMAVNMNLFPSLLMIPSRLIAAMQISLLIWTELWVYV